MTNIIDIRTRAERGKEIADEIWLDIEAYSQRTRHEIIIALVRRMTEETDDQSMGDWLHDAFALGGIAAATALTMKHQELRAIVDAMRAEFDGGDVA